MSASALALVTFADELWSGVAVVAAPEVERLHAIDHAQYTFWVFAVPMLAATLIEAPLSLLSDRWPRRRVLSVSLWALAVALSACALAWEPWLLAAGLALAGAASGLACTTAQGELVETFAGGAQRAMSRWIAVAAAGDAVTPLVVAVSGSHRVALGLLALLIAASALRVWRGVPMPGAAHDEDEAVVPLRAALRSALKQPRLWLLSCVAATCILLDEVVVAMAALRLHDDYRWSEEHIAMLLTALSAGGVVGGLLNEQLLARWSPRALMIGSALSSLVCLAGFILSPAGWIACAALCLLGVTAAAHYPLVHASAFELVPRQPGLVNALAQLFV
ncbi:MAG TPA: MFS transporter, partial [Polyangiales bacterium]|nr:MFS transporter [Polyangiales bacterium]